MTQDEFQDAITYKQPLIKEITNEATMSLFDDRNLLSVLKFLRTSDVPLTVKELELAFKRAKQIKSQKSIYRYLKKLEEHDLVVQAGKRVYPLKKNKLTTQTLYARSARIFFPVGQSTINLMNLDDSENKKLIHIIGEMLGTQINGELISLDLLYKVIRQIQIRQGKLFRSLMNDSKDKISNLLVEINWETIERLVAIVSLLVLFNDETNWQEELNSCFTILS